MKLRSHPAVLIVATSVAALFFSGPSFAQSTNAQPLPVTGVITGRVLDSGGDPLPGAVVYAGSVGGTRRSQSAKADQNGDFKIAGLPPGVYRLSPIISGYTTAIQFGFNAQAFYRLGDSVRLTMHRGGVITGKVTGSNGPLIALGVFAIRVRDEAHKPLPIPSIWRERSTDDRGIYRIYGLPPGSYLVVAAKPRLGMIAPSAYDYDTPTYFPSSPRDTASEIAVREGEEITADIQYRAERGYAISGQVLGLIEAQEFRASATISLVDVRDRSAVSSTFANSSSNSSFAFTGVPAGEYELSAYQFLQTRDEFRSAPRRVTIRGSDVTGVTLTLAKQAAIEGRLVFEADAKNHCGTRRDTAAQETIVFGRRYEPDKKDDGEKRAPAEVTAASANHVSVDVGDANGRFALRNLRPGSYRIDPLAPATGWYLQSIALNPAGASLRAALTSSRDSVAVKAGETVAGLTVTFSEGAASVRGAIASEGQRLPVPNFVYLVPADKQNPTNLFRYFEAPVAGDGSFAIGNIAPGDYFIVALKSDGDVSTGIAIRADGDLRATVVREAEKLQQRIALKPCARLDKYELRYPPTIKP